MCVSGVDIPSMDLNASLPEASPACASHVLHTFESQWYLCTILYKAEHSEETVQGGQSQKQSGSVLEAYNNKAANGHRCT